MSTATERQPFDTDSLERPVTRRAVIVEFTQHKVIWVEADSQADAVREVERDIADGDVDWAGADDCEVQTGIEITDGWAARHMIDDVFSAILNDCGPVECCPRCGAVARGVHSTALIWADHADDCPSLRHRVDLTPVYRRKEDGRPDYGTPAGYAVECSCGEPGTIDRRGRFPERPCVGEPGAPEPVTRKEAAALARAHVEGRPHGKNVPLGIMENHYEPHPRTLAAAPACPECDAGTVVLPTMDGPPGPCECGWCSGSGRRSGGAS